MAIKFEFYESPNTIGTRKKRYHARVVNWQRINTDYLAREIQYGSSLTVADIKATIISLSEKLAYYLKDGSGYRLKGQVINCQSLSLFNYLIFPHIFPTTVYLSILETYFSVKLCTFVGK